MSKKFGKTFVNSNREFQCNSSSFSRFLDLYEDSEADSTCVVKVDDIKESNARNSILTICGIDKIMKKCGTANKNQSFFL